MTNRTRTDLSKRFLSILLLGCGIATLSAFSDSGTVSRAVAETHATSPMRWGHDLRTALDTARGSNRLVLVDVYTDWCHWCKVLDRDVYSDPQVASYLNNNFICVKVNGDDPTLGTWVKTKYDVSGFPAVLVLKNKETVVGRIGGFEPKEQFLDHIKMFAAQGQGQQTR
jgi:thiol:disulfide interchange protein